MKNKRVYNFVIRLTKEEREIISAMRIDGVNVSAFIRKCLIEKYIKEKKV